IQSRLEANNLKEAMENFPEAMKISIEKMLENLKKMQQKEESRLIVP
ncbi:MAG: cytoplasmic protein, partial [Desulfobacterales bacterium]|nr:cytoplasmic protein [Desulfobacterales bacterium]